MAPTATAKKASTKAPKRPKKDSYDSDALDESDSDSHTAKKRKRVNASTPRKKAKVVIDVDADEDFELEDGQSIVGTVVQAPKEGQVPPGQISQNTLNFLASLKDPKCNDREWFKLHEPVYRQAEKEWKDFVEAFTDQLAEVDSQIPQLPPKDVIHRIYRDVRFSNDKTPYKRNFSASFSRSGRKGIFAGYHISISSGGSMIAAGTWCPGKTELNFLRASILRDPSRLRQVISAKEFVKYFGPAKAGGKRQNIFGRDDELKVSPKGIDKAHKDIDLLKCRSFAVSHQFSDDEVLSKTFAQKLAEVATVMQPLVHCLNDMMTIQADDDDDANEDEDEDEDED
ncbi:hypothetical protein C8J56DRAFT_927809 [Mycena floridula]|nr:hypothetical protein C8J56DRAFT_927809 [Mycena floridula]